LQNVVECLTDVLLLLTTSNYDFGQCQC